MTDQPFAGKQLVAGDTWNWTIELDDYSPAQYTLKYSFRGPSALDLTAVAAANGSAFNVIATGAQTSPLLAGTYAFQMSVFDASNNRTELDRGNVEMLADIAAAVAGAEERSWVKQMLDAIQGTLLGTASRQEQEYQVNGRSLRLSSRTELLKIESEFEGRYRKEQIACGALPPQTNQVHACFGDPTNPILVRLWKNFPGSSS
jgi:hypothetical protein